MPQNLRKALAPGQMCRAPAKLALSLRIRAAAHLRHHDHQVLARERPTEPGRHLKRPHCAEHLRQRSKPILHLGRLVNDDVVDLARLAAIDRSNGGRRGIPSDWSRRVSLCYVETCTKPLIRRRYPLSSGTMPLQRLATCPPPSTRRWCSTCCGRTPARLVIFGIPWATIWARSSMKSGPAAIKSRLA